MGSVAVHSAGEKPFSLSMRTAINVNSLGLQMGGRIGAGLLLGYCAMEGSCLHSVPKPADGTLGPDPHLSPRSSCGFAAGVTR